MARIGLISLGCPKNTVDAEEILGEVEKAGHEIETDPARAEVLIVNTCGFIRSAKEEAVDCILDAVRYKTNGACRSVIVTGCLVQRHGEQLAKELPEADAFLGLGKVHDIAETISRTLRGGRVMKIGEPCAWWMESRSRVLSTPPWTAYLRIADGCDNRCAYCVIPSIRGGFRSRPEEIVLDEARALAKVGVKELNLVAQDITRYGLDAEGELLLPRLLEKLAALEGIHWIRLLYCYPTRITDELIRAIAENEKVCRYIDVPLQHCSDRILRAMGRQGSKQAYLDLFARIRESCPEAALRTTLMVGFPGETEEEFEELMDFVERVRFDRVGVFPYSAEEGTRAALLPDKVHRSTIDRRYCRLMQRQQEISLDTNKKLVGTRIEVLIEGIKGDSLVGRSCRDAPDIDGLVYVEGASALPGEFVLAEVIEARHYDLLARCD
ncbi:MAG TPA: 30S ribosomal protein S12 methylthiotransferase RimO [Armatimonadota bacterium]|nr:30S ribosomal protein S12 methylthiotransferase RimO [Armatimonadota bacterium]